MLRGTLVWVSTIGGVLALLFLFLDSLGVVSVSPWLTGALILASVCTAFALAASERRARREEQSRKVEENKAVLRDEIQANLQVLASRIDYVRVMEPQTPAIPRYPGEPRAGFEARARDEFARWVEYFVSMSQQFPLTEATYAAHRVNVAAFEEPDRLAVERAYEAIAEAKRRFLHYGEQLRGLLAFDDSVARRRRARLLGASTANALTDQWFKALENWLLLDPGETGLRAVHEVILPQVLAEEALPSRLEAGVEGRRFALRQRSRLWDEKTALLREEAALDSENAAGTKLPPPEEPPEDAVDAVGKAGLAYFEGDPNDAVAFLEAALRFGTLTTDQEHYVKTSLAYLADPDLFGGTPGVYLVDIEDSAGAATAGLERGDVIVRYDHAPVAEPAKLSSMVAAARGVPSVAVEVVRAERPLTMHLEGGKSLGATGTTLVHFAPSAL